MYLHEPRVVVMKYLLCHTPIQVARVKDLGALGAVKVGILRDLPPTSDVSIALGVLAGDRRVGEPLFLSTAIRNPGQGVLSWATYLRWLNTFECEWDWATYVSFLHHVREGSAKPLPAPWDIRFYAKDGSALQYVQGVLVPLGTS